MLPRQLDDQLIPMPTVHPPNRHLPEARATISKARIFDEITVLISDLV